MVALFLFQFNCQSQQIKILSATANPNNACASQAYQNIACGPGWVGSIPLKTNGVDWIQFDLGSTFNVTQINITVTLAVNGSNFCGFTIQGSIDGSSYTIISILSNISFNNNIATLTINTYSPCKYIKLTNFLYCNIPGNVPVYFSDVSIYGIATQSFNSIFVTGISFLEGNVGIGGAPTKDMLFVNGTINSNGVISAGSIAATSGTLTLSGSTFTVSSGALGDIVNINVGGTGGLKTFATFDYNTLNKITFNYPLVLNGNLTATGNVGIGTTNNTVNGTTYKLAVSGSIVATSFDIVKTVPAADYVFEPTYKLKSLTEIEKYVKENKHLPEIPSAKEFKEKGCDVGEIDNMLLKKVEELTLYVIDLNKKVEALEKENAALKTTK